VVGIGHIQADVIATAAVRRPPEKIEPPVASGYTYDYTQVTFGVVRSF